DLIRLVEESDIQELEITGPFRSVRIARSAPRPAPPAAESGPVPVTPGPPVEPGAPEEESEPAPDMDSGLVPIESPMVGTFYAAPSPEAPPYVRPGDRVSKGQVVCIVEAMKIVNEIESEVSGTIVRVMAENAQPVEYGQELFLVQPD
ncbi:MAG: acetyl-CoA carboxylase biotin carboxyl carrier protein, partial [Candidatus Eisenbacteria bacterium]|nr:acetyl-CoA carboxylase biotin carboxyl carrier protein [Candidatus Eisenbacteria bacterium]